MMARRRARDAEGQFVGDDPTTPGVNEAYDAPTEESAPAAPARRRKAVPSEVMTPEGAVTIRQAIPRLNGERLLDYCKGGLDVDVNEADQAVQIAHASLEAYVGSPIPACPAPVEQTAILQCAVQVIARGWNRPGRILREREIPAQCRAAVTYRLMGRKRPSVYDPQGLGAPIKGVTRLTR